MYIGRMRRYRHGEHTKTDLKVHLVWIPKYRKPVLTGDIAIRVRDLIRQIAMEHELEIISGKVASDHIHVFLSYRAHQCEISFFGAKYYTVTPVVEDNPPPQEPEAKSPGKGRKKTEAKGPRPPGSSTSSGPKT